MKDIADNIIETYNGSFRTNGGETGIEDSILQDDASVSVRKILRNGQVIIIMPNGDKFDIAGKKID